jgi:CYTH domain-containing protein
MKGSLKKSKLNQKNQRIKIQGQQRKMLMIKIKKKNNISNNQKKNLPQKKTKMSLMTLINFYESLTVIIY